MSGGTEVSRVALHEAAHAVVSHVLGSPVKGITIIPTNVYAGCVWHLLPENRIYFQSDAIIALAGSACERMFFGDELPSRPDYLHAAQHTGCGTSPAFDAVLPSRPTQRFRDALHEADRLVAMHRMPILELAKILMQRQHLNDMLEIERLLSHLAENEAA